MDFKTSNRAMTDVGTRGADGWFPGNEGAGVQQAAGSWKAGSWKQQAAGSWKRVAGGRQRIAPRLGLTSLHRRAADRLL